MKLNWPKSNRNAEWVDVAGLSGLAALLVARFIPVARLPFWGCAFRKATGWPCPACGLTRVFDRLSHFNLAGAWDANPLGTVTGILLVLLALAAILHLAFKVPLPSVELTPREARALRVTVWTLILLNYAFVIVKTKFPAWL